MCVIVKAVHQRSDKLHVTMAVPLDDQSLWSDSCGAIRHTGLQMCALLSAADAVSSLGADEISRFRSNWDTAAVLLHAIL